MKTLKPTTPVVETSAKASAHSPCTLAVAACRLAAIAAIAEPIQLVAKAYAAESRRQAAVAQEASADDKKDAKQIALAYRWVEAAEMGSTSTSR